MALGILAWPWGVSGQEDTTLSFAETDELSIVFDSATDNPTELVAITNDGPTELALSFSILLADEDSPSSDDVTVQAEPTEIGPFATAWIELTFGRSGSEDLSGYLVVTGDGAGVAFRPLSVATDDAPITVTYGQLKFLVTIPGGPAAVLFLGALFSAILLAARLLTKRYDWGKPMGKREWKFSESWASTFTAVGAIFGTVLAAGVLPDEPALLGKAQYAGLNVLFGSLLVVSGFVFDATRRRNGQGQVWAFFLSSFVMFTAVFGELLTLLLLSTDSASKLDSATLTFVLRALTVIVIVLIGVYGFRAIDEAYRAGTRKVRTKKKLVMTRAAVPIEIASADYEDVDLGAGGEAEIETPLSWVMP